jgi:hypothetical protein
MNQLQDLYEYLNKASMSGMSERSANHVSAAIALVKQMMQAEPVAWAYEGEPSFDGTKWHKKIEVTTSFQVAKFKSGTIKKPIPLYTAPQAVPAWLPIDSAPKDGAVILGYCVHTADPYFTGERLTDYGARCEGLGHVEDGIHAILWESAREESDGWESPSYCIPAGWVHNADCEQMANPTHWVPLPAAPKGAV